MRSFVYRETVLDMLGLLGVGEAEHWLWPEVARWDTLLQGHSETWKSLQDRADSWLYLWISKLKVRRKDLFAVFCLHSLKYF